MRRPRVLALAIDGSNQDLLDQWLEAGHLPALRRLRDEASSHSIRSDKAYSNEHCWIPLLTGQGRHRFAHWMDQWDPVRYEFNEASIFDWLRAPVFYALGDRCKVISFDLTAPVVAGVDGLQVSGWGTELNEAIPASDPPGLLDELLARHGPDPKLADSFEVTNGPSQRAAASYVFPSVYDSTAVAAFAGAQLRSVDRRTAACLDLMSRIDWDLFIGCYSEPHTAGHLFWHLGRPHALHSPGAAAADPMLETFKAVDSSIARLLQQLDDTDHAVVFTIDDMAPDSLENARAAILPEFMYRWNFGGRAALAEGDAAMPVPPPRRDYREHWKHEVWKLRTPAGERDLESPSTQQARRDAMSWCPANWYRPMWPRMRAFAMPTVADGYIRLNVRGRERDGMVTVEEFAPECERLRDALLSMTNARTGQPLVAQVILVRESPFETDPSSPPADIVVVFREDGAVDTADSPAVGRIGPLPFFRTGSHPAHGARLRNEMWIRGTRAAPGTRGAAGRLEDIPATILSLLGIDIPGSFDGVPLA